VVSVFRVQSRPLSEPRAFTATWAALFVAVAIGCALAATFPAGVALLVVALTAAAAMVSAPTCVTVGTDGLHFRWLGTSRFVSHAEIEAIERIETTLALVLGSGEVLHLSSSGMHTRAQPELDVLHARLEETWLEHRTLTSAAGGWLTTRSGRTMRDWVHAMRMMLTVQNGYRTPVVPRERLWAVVENPKADPSARTGAAVALSGRLDPEERARLRIAASACAEPRVRVALALAATEACAGTSDEQLASALEAAEGDAESTEAGVDTRRSL
jgi:hypothetical protein